LGFCGRAETNFDSPASQGCEESVDAVGVGVGRLGVNGSGVYEVRDDLLSLLSREDLFAFESSNAVKSRFDGPRDSLVCLNGRVMYVLGLRSFRCGRSSQTKHRPTRFERRVRGCTINPIACKSSILVDGGNLFSFR
jgi:hypothetical protein